MATLDAARSLARRLPPTLAVVLATVLIWCLGVIGLGKPLDGRIHDALIRATTGWSPERSRVLLVYAHRRIAREAPDWITRVADRLSAAGSLGVGVFIPAADMDHDMIAQAVTARHIFLMRDGPQNSHHFVDRDQSPRAPSLADPTGVPPAGSLTLPPADGGVVRYYYGRGVRGGRWSLEAIIGRSVLGDVQRIPVGCFEVWFRGGIDSLPHIDAATVLDEEVIPELVAGKVALIGYAPDSMSPGITTPTTPRARMSLLEFHGHALNTVLTGASIVGFGQLPLLTVMIITGLCGCLLYRRVDPMYLLPLLLSATMAILVAAFTCLVVWHIRLPVVPLVAAQIAAVAVTVAYRYRLAREALLALLRQRSVHTRATPVPSTSTSLADTWAQLAELIDQLFYIERMVVFELAPGSQHLVPVQAVHCDLDDLAERRRDYRRVPFADASDANGPIRVAYTQFRFFKSSQESDTQFLAPIKFEGVLLGFLATDIGTHALEACSDFDQMLHRVADETAAVLAYRRAAQQSQQRRAWLRRLVQVPEQPLVAELEQTSRSVEQRLGYFEQAFESSASPSSVFDLFGKTMLINEGMRRVLDQRHIAIADVRAIDLLGELSGQSVQACRQVMRCVILDRREQVIPLIGGDGQQSQLHIRPLIRRAATAGGTRDAPRPFHVHGIHFELAARIWTNAPNALGSETTDDVCRSLESTIDQLSHAAAYLTGTDEKRGEHEVQAGESGDNAPVPLNTASRMNA